jgi:hypothetical protein
MQPIFLFTILFILQQQATHVATTGTCNEPFARVTFEADENKVYSNVFANAQVETQSFTPFTGNGKMLTRHPFKDGNDGFSTVIVFGNGAPNPTRQCIWVSCDLPVSIVSCFILH